jgi:hypothetical protein
MSGSSEHGYEHLCSAKGVEFIDKMSVLLYWVLKNDSPTSCQLVRFHVLTAASMKIRAFWDVAPCSLLGVDRRTSETSVYSKDTAQHYTPEVSNLPAVSYSLVQYKHGVLTVPGNDLVLAGKYFPTGLECDLRDRLIRLKWTYNNTTVCRGTVLAYTVTGDCQL